MPIIPNSLITSSKLGFGTSGIMGSALTHGGRTKLLDCAFDQGITHFDTAPLYGIGEAEKVVGSFLKNKRDKVTVTTKFGHAPVTLPKHIQAIVPIARYINRRSNVIRALKKSLLAKQIALKHGEMPKSGLDQNTDKDIFIYKKADLADYLNQSLKKLKTDYIDVFLMHECVLENLNDEFISSLEECRRSGKIRCYGFATGPYQIARILAQYPHFKGVIQMPSSGNIEELEKSNVESSLFTITHSVFAQTLDKLKLLLTNSETRKRWSHSLDTDLCDHHAIADLLLALSVEINDAGIVLFSSKSKNKIRHNARFIETNSVSTDILTKFQKMLAQEII